MNFHQTDCIDSYNFMIRVQKHGSSFFMHKCFQKYSKCYHPPNNDKERAFIIKDLFLFKLKVTDLQGNKQAKQSHVPSSVFLVFFFFGLWTLCVRAGVAAEYYRGVKSKIHFVSIKQIRSVGASRRIGFFISLFLFSSMYY